MNNFKSLKPWVYKKIVEIIDLNPQLACEKHVEILTIEISKELKTKLYEYLSKNYLITHSRFSEGGRYDGKFFYIYTIKFKITENRETNKIHINEGGTTGTRIVNKYTQFANPYEADDETKVKLTPTMLQLFYGFLKKYPEHILNVRWKYREPENYDFIS